MKTVSPENVGLSSSRLDRINSAMRSFVEQGKLSGAVTMLARQGQLVHAECFGLRDIQAQKPMQVDTLFPIFSMTKPILAVAMMILYEEGRYQLFDPLARFVPEFKDVKVIKKTSEAGIELANLDRDITIYLN